jgi:hypothetical protein
VSDGLPGADVFDQQNPLDGLQIAGSNPPAQQPAPQEDQPSDQSPLDSFGEISATNTVPQETSAFGSAARGAERSLLPAAGSLAAAGTGAELGGALGSALGPVGTVVGTAAGGIGGAIAGGKAVEAAQNWVLSKLPSGFVDAFGLDEAKERLDQQEHPVASFVGGLVPYAVTMSPGAVAKTALPENATALQRLMSNPVTARLFGGGVMGGMELTGELEDHEDLDWRKIGIATGFGMVFNKPNKLGESITERGAGPVRTALGRPSPTVAQAGDLKVMGPGITEQVFQGTHEQAPQAAMVAQETARAENPEAQEPDVGAVARQMEPELFGRYDELQKRKEAFSAWMGEGPEQLAAGEHLAKTNAEIAELSPEISAAYRRAADTIGTETIPAEPFKSFAEMLAAHERGPTAQAPNAPAAPEGETPAAPRSIADQRAFIANDVAQRLIAAGRPEDEAQAAGQLKAAYYVTRAARFQGKLGSAEDLYAREDSSIAGPEGKPVAPSQPPARDVVQESAAAGEANQQAAQSAQEAIKPTAATTEPGVLANDIEGATRIKNEWRDQAPFKDIDQFIEASKPNQEQLGSVGEEIAKATGTEFKNPGIKAKDEKGRTRLATKAERRGIGAVTDQVRGGFKAETPQQVDQIIAGLAKHFPVIDEGWQTTPSGYFDRKAYVRFPDGMIGEIQVWPPGMAEAKGSAGRGHVLYEGVRELPPWHPLIPEFQRTSSALYGDVRAKLSAEWNAVLGSGGNLPNSLPNASGESTEALRPTSAALTSTQEPLSSAQASEGVQKAGSPSQEHGLISDISGVSEQNIGEHTAPVNAALAARDRIDELSPAEQKRELPTYTAAAEQAPQGRDQPAGVFMFDPTKLNVDAKRFQFKSGGDEYGVTGALRNVQKWDPAKAQSIIVWEANDGQLFVADGHQRSGLARRLVEQGKAKDIQLPGVLYREKDGISSEDIRAIAAVTNIANGSGSALDGAKVLRERPDLLDESLPLSAGKGKQAAALARLGDEPFRMVVNQVVPEHYGAVVGDLIPSDPDRQVAALKAIARFEPKNADEAAVLTQRVAQAELAKREEGAQTSMFGDLETPESTAGEEMKIVGRAIADLKKDKALFSRVLRNATRIEETGSSIEREAAQTVQSEAEIFAKTLTSEAYASGPIRTELVAAARELKNGKSTIGQATDRILAALRAQAEANDADRAGAVGPGAEEREFAQNDLFEEEPGAEGKPQTLIPGVAPISERERIQALANKPLRGGNKAPPEGGLFGSSKDQQELFQIANGKITLRRNQRPVITLLKTQNASTFVHESGHEFLEQMQQDAAHPEAPNDIKQDFETVKNWLGVGEDGIKTKHHEKFARGFEQYMREGVAPSKGLARVFAQFRDWLLQIYQSIKGLGKEISPEIRDVFDRMLELEPQRTVIAPERAQPDLLHDIHEAEAAHTEPHEAEPAMDRVIAERDRYIADQPPEIVRELETASAKIEAAEAAATGEAAEPAGEATAGAGGPSALESGGAGSEPQSGGGAGGEEHGTVEPGGGGAGAEGNAGAAGPDLRSKLGDQPGTALAPGPADLFGPRESPLVDKAGNIRLDNLNLPEDVAQAIRIAAQENNDFIGDRRGVITDGQVMDLANDLGMDEAMLNRRQIGQAFNAEQIWAARKLLVQSATRVAETMKKAAIGTDADVLAYAQAKDRHQMIQAQVAGITAEAGRALRAFRSMAGMEQAKEIGLFIQEATGKTLYQLRAEAKLGAELQTPQQVSKMMHDATKNSFGRMVLEYWINGLISGPATHMTYAVGNTISSLLRIPEQFAAAGVARAAGALGREGAGVRPGEAGAMARGLAQGLPAAIKAGIGGLETGLTTQLPGEAAAQGNLFQTGALNLPAQFQEGASYHDAMAAAFGMIRGMRDGILATGKLLAAGGVHGEPLVGTKYSPLGAIPDITYRGVNVLPVGSAVRAPGRFIAAIHSFYRSVNFSMEKNALAYRKAVEEGLSGEALDARVAQLRADPSEQTMNEIATNAATQTVLMGKGSEFTRALSRLTNTPIFGFPLLKFVDPFVHISGNVIEQGVLQRTPAGLLTLFSPETELARDLRGGNGAAAQDKAIGRMLVGSALSITFGGLAAQGLMSGSGPSDPRQAAMWRQAGNQAHSVRIGDIWYDVHRLGPLGMLAGISADLFDVAHQAERGELLEAAAHLQHAFTQNILDESFMRGPADLIQAVEDPGRYGESYIRNFLSSFVPFSVGMSQVARASDPYSRQARTLADAIKAKVPGLSETLFPRRDVWGEAMPSREVLGAPGVSAIYMTRMNNDPVNKAMLDLNIYPAQVQRKIRGVELTGQEYDDYARIAGRMTKSTLDRIVNSPAWNQMPVEAKHYAVQHTIDMTRNTAREMILGKYPHIAADATAVKQMRARGERP